MIYEAQIEAFTGIMPSQVSGHRQNARGLRVGDILSAEKEGRMIVEGF
jgi:hypothetical protein